MAGGGADERDATLKEFDQAVNMTAKELERWLATDESQSVGQKDGEGDESVGHEMGRHIVELLGKHKADYDDEDLRRMRKVSGYVHRHTAQGGPKDDPEHSRWRCSLMNWGHDPLKR